MWSRQLLVLGVIPILFAVVPATADEAAVKKMISDYADAFNAKQIETVMSFWTENGVHVDLDTGERTEGRDAIQADMQAALANMLKWEGFQETVTLLREILRRQAELKAETAEEIERQAAEIFADD